ncbi:MAG: hypothetical protein ACI85O_003199 [Saprospiraceae bacterium]
MKEGIRKIKESNSYEYDDKMRVKKKKYQIHLFDETTGESSSVYDILGNLTTETIIEDTVKVLHYYTDEIKRKSEIFFTKRGGKIHLEYDYEGKMILLEGKTVNGVITQEYEYDRKGNWIKKHIYEQIGDEPKRLKRGSKRKILYRD